MTGYPVRQFEKLSQKFLLHMAENLHINRSFPATKRAKEGDRHKITELMTGRVARARIVYIIEIAV